MPPSQLIVGGCLMRRAGTRLEYYDAEPQCGVRFPGSQGLASHLQLAYTYRHAPRLNRLNPKRSEGNRERESQRATRERTEIRGPPRSANKALRLRLTKLELIPSYQPVPPVTGYDATNSPRATSRANGHQPQPPKLPLLPTPMKTVLRSRHPGGRMLTAMPGALAGLAAHTNQPLELGWAITWLTDLITTASGQT
ncbi:hypothetical protein NL676_003731 [Syzygium grande]|nr:hypothetical protein NL676_003731 [Syzygium grande]